MSAASRGRLCAVVLAAAAVACGGDSTGPTSDQPATLSQALAELTIPALAVGGPSLVDFDIPAASFDPTTCSFSTTAESFFCAPISEGGITIKPRFTLLTASNARQSAFDPASTASVRVNTSLAGTLVEQGSSLALNGDQETTLSGLLSGPHVLDGVSRIVIAGTVADETTTYPVDIRVNTSILNLVLPANEAGSARVWPTSGTIVGDINGTFGPVPVTQRTTISFNGTSQALVHVSSGFQSKSCKVDLAVAPAVC